MGCVLAATVLWFLLKQNASENRPLQAPDDIYRDARYAVAQER